jgi:hypothetical protein
MALYLSNLALINDTEGSYLAVTNVVEGVDGSAVFGYNAESDTVKIQSNRTQVVSLKHALDIMIIDDSANQAILTEWSNTPEFMFKAVGYGGDTFLLWDSPVNLSIPRQYDKIVTRKAGLTLQALSGYSGVQPLTKAPIYAGRNLLALYKVWEGNSTLLNGFTVSGTMVTSQSAGSQTITRGADTDAWLYSQPILFPFIGVTLTASMTTTAHTGLGEFGFRYLDNSGNELSIDVTSFVSGGTVRRSHSAITPADTFSIQFIVAPGQTLGNATTFNSPMIGLDYNSTFES